MRSIRLRAAVPTADAPAVLAGIADFAAFPALAPDVRSVDVDAGESRWAVAFRRGLLGWTERDTVDSARLRIDFRQVTGDFADFHGSWRVAPGPACEVLFEVTYDFGIDSMAAILDPIAERVIKRVVRSVLLGLFGGAEVLEGGEALTDRLSDLGRAA